jgi:uncharacterized membrane protein YeaQ/YmgE (transglycosylase-associated protein family)
MIGMDFGAFLVLLVASVIAAFVIHYLFRYRVLTGFDGFLGKWIVGWIGAWLGSPVLGYWFGPFQLAHVYLIPVLIGAFAAAFGTTSFCKALAQVNGGTGQEAPAGIKLD